MSKNLIILIGIIALWFCIIRPLNSDSKSEENKDDTGKKKQLPPLSEGVPNLCNGIPKIDENNKLPNLGDGIHLNISNGLNKTYTI